VVELTSGEGAVFTPEELPRLWLSLRALRLRQHDFDPIWE